MWTASHSETVRAQAREIWQRWTEVTRWPEQDASLVSASINGPFAVGSVITLKPKGSPAVTVTLVELTPNVSFSSVGKLPLAQLRFDHTIDEMKDGVRFTQSVSMTGPLAWLWSGLMGSTMAANLTARMQRLAQLVTT